MDKMISLESCNLYKSLAGLWKPSGSSQGKGSASSDGKRVELDEVGAPKRDGIKDGEIQNFQKTPLLWDARTTQDPCLQW